MPSALQLRGPLGTDRAGWEAAARALVIPATRAAALGPDHTPVVMSNHDPLANWFELVARPLWGLAPLAAGGGAAPAAWAEVRASLAAAVDPSHRWYVGEPRGVDQKLVESAAVGYALAVAPEQLWEPLTGRQRDHLASWLSAAYLGEVADTNWHFFPVLVGLGLDRLGIARDRSVSAAHLAAIAGFATGDGWYVDGPGGRVDYYNAFAFHWYGLVFAALAADDRFVPGALAFAEEFAHWFAADGAAVPYGRSLGYRFAQGAFWGALACAGVPGPGWPQVRGLAQRHLHWWWRQPVLDHSGALTIGYGYPNDAVVEQYLTAGSPYWGLKVFAPLTLDDAHPFWQARPAPPVRGRVEVRAQPAARAVLARDADGDVVRLNGQAWHPWARNGQATYAKFAYGTLAGFAVPTPGPGRECASPDSALLLSEDGRHWRGREDSPEGKVHEDTVVVEWTPWPDVRVTTVLVAAPPWHLRVHQVVTGRALRTVEGGWCVPWQPDGAGVSRTAAWASATSPAPHPPPTSPAHPNRPTPTGPLHAAARFARLRSSPGQGGLERTGDAGGVHSLLVDLAGGHDDPRTVRRTPEVIAPMPGTHLLWPRTLLPVLGGALPAGEHRLACAVRVGRRPAVAECPAELRQRVDGLLREDFV